MYELMKLPYGINALEPQIDGTVMDPHYNLLYKTYYNKLMEELRKNNYNFQYSLEELPQHIEEFPLVDRGVILHNLGGVLNHNLYWLSMNPSPSAPSGKLLEKINSQFGSFNNFVRDYTARAQFLIGSGYTTLVTNAEGELIIINMANQETPYSYNLTPLFTIDLWEHAYYPQYLNDKASYINNFWQKANFDYASNKYKEMFG